LTLAALLGVAATLRRSFVVGMVGETRVANVVGAT
jgi:hypothetical protein